MVEKLALSRELSVLGTVGTISANETHTPGAVTRGTEREETNNDRVANLANC